jgi:hypothetical protein
VDCETSVDKAHRKIPRASSFLLELVKNNGLLGEVAIAWKGSQRVSLIG